MWWPEILQTSGFSIAINLINCSLRTSNYSAKHICYYFHHSKGIISFDKLFLAYVTAFSVAILMSRRANFEN